MQEVRSKMLEVDRKRELNYTYKSSLLHAHQKKNQDSPNTSLSNIQNYQNIKWEDEASNIRKMYWEKTTSSEGDMMKAFFQWRQMGKSHNTSSISGLGSR
ncbi:hypothetical protein QJS10_CPB22g00370 [Acorus calamus]|uniref:Uncharacterized protein n=1 Tax=Acorus calamus TaxID=4465 RepID=A0AAV9BXT2_ACOCL|nr:hypothetical protein QJS10_CPB22g00370 [Acorus calamus]